MPKIKFALYVCIIMYVFSLRELMFTLTFAKTNYALHVYMRYVRTMLFNLSHIHVIHVQMDRYFGPVFSH